MGKEFLFRELLNTIRHLNCHFDYHEFHQFIMEDEQREFRLGGNFGYGFKIYKKRNQYVFGQYSEDKTEESERWIQTTNEKMKEYMSQVS